MSEKNRKQQRSDEPEALEDQEPQPEPRDEVDTEREEHLPGDEEVVEASEDSFPASDAPAW